MRRVFSSRIVSEAVLVRDALLHHGIDATIQNENSGFSAVPEFRPPADIWITRDADYAAAKRVVEDALSTMDSKAEDASWHCAGCDSENPASFELCWNCGRLKAGPGSA